MALGRFAGAILLGLIALTELAHAEPTCDDAELAPRLATFLHTQRFADAHHAAVAAHVLCGDAAPLQRTRIIDAIALLRLEDRDVALRDLQALAPDNDAARIVLAWAYVDDGDREAAAAILPRLPAPRAAALRALDHIGDEARFADAIRGVAPPLQPRAAELGAGYRGARAKRPALAGVLSALIPGTGQIYAGSWQAAGVTFVLNGLFIAATVELVHKDLYFTAAATGTAASFFYVGGIMNAVDLARRRNAIAQEPYGRELERLLVPELDGAL